MHLIVYATFSDPYSYLASRRVDALGAAGVMVDWRACDPRPETAVGGHRRSPAELDEPAGRLADLVPLLADGERLPARAPALRPHSDAACAALAEATVAGAPDDVRRLLFGLYWESGADIGDPAVLRTPLTGAFLRAPHGAEPLRQSGFAVGAARTPVTSAAWQLVRDWQDGWRRLGAPDVPAVELDGALVTGLDAVQRLTKELDARGVPYLPALPDAGGYPAGFAVTSPPAWASRAGGRWLFQHRAPLSRQLRA